ncbi:unnamed protein product [Clonostachys rhizophaga]|uniref:Uncharacterized protein n=1 Tax=Clonostachys rhizophaga TaxID=160324 RepID=A0A9N9YKC1_9HYPO|nr:unnamed protein product [Clonostachys rhizophaga]
MKSLLTHDTGDADIVLTYIRNVIGIATYLNDDTLHNKMKNIIMEFRKQLRVAERAHLARTGVKVEAVAFFDEWMPTLFERIRGDMISFATTWCDKLDAAWQNVPQAQGVIQQTTHLRASATATRTIINQRNFYDPV